LGWHLQIAGFLVFAVAAHSQDFSTTEQAAVPAEPGTRTALMEQRQTAKTASLQPQQKDRAEEIFDRAIDNAGLKRLLGNQNGLGIQFGTLFPGSGFALGPDYSLRGLLNENLDVQFAAIGSLKQYYEVRGGASFRHLAGNRVRIDLHARRMDAPQVHYYGPGNDSSVDAKTNYRLEAGLFDGRISAMPFRRILSVGATTGYTMLNVGPGQADEIPSSERLFTPRNAPGINRQTNYLHGGPFIELDWRDQPGDPHRGGAIGVNYHWNVDRVGGAFSFRRAQMYIEQYLPLLNEKRVIALRARTTLSYTRSDEVLPYYMQPTLGGPNDLRGYSQFRFYDKNAMVLNAEYRRELGPPLDLVLFTDWGKVFSKPGALAFSELHGSGGVGFRFKTRSSVIMRIDVGFSQEGVKFWWAFSDIFRGFLQNLH
jgi:hypothetical protein